MRRPFLFFFLSGFTSLVLEVVWGKKFSVIFGNTTLAYAAVVGAFMSGLAIGSFIFGRIADRHPAKGLKLYGLLEGTIAVFALIFPFLIKLLFPLYESIYNRFYSDFLTISLIRYVIAFCLLLIPTILMGGTLPLLSRYLAQFHKDAAGKISALYGMNLLGAMCGSFSAGFILLPTFGSNQSVSIAAVINLWIAYMVLRSARKKSIAFEVSSEKVQTEQQEDAAEVLSVQQRKLILLLLVIHGFAAFVVQISWTRTMILILGSSTYSFSSILTTFLAGLGIGTWIINRLASSGKRFSLTHLGWFELCVGSSLLLFNPVFERLVLALVRLYPLFSSHWVITVLMQFLFCFIAMIIPTTIMGLVYPATLTFVRNTKNIGGLIGHTYAVNTIGGVAGCFLTGFVLIRVFGIQGALQCAALCSILIGLYLIISEVKGVLFHPRVIKAVGASVLSSLFILYPWDATLFSSGVFMYADGYSSVSNLSIKKFKRYINDTNNLVFYKEGQSATVSVFKYESGGGSVTSLKVNGKTDASSVGDMRMQLYLGFIPLMAHPDPKDICVIGFGSGTTAGAATLFKDIEHIDVVEIEPAVVEAHEFFLEANHNVMEDPRVNVVIGDGRNHLSFVDKKYDVIISEPSNPWISGVSSLFTKETYEVGKKKLKPGGIYSQWLHAYQMSEEDFLMIMKTFSSSFKFVNLFMISEGDFFILGSDTPIEFSIERLLGILGGSEKMRKDLAKFSDHASRFIFGTFMLGTEDLKRELSKNNIPFNTDNHLRLEYNAPKFMHQYSLNKILKWLYSYPRVQLAPRVKDASEEEVLNSYIYFKHAERYVKSGFYTEAVKYFRKALPGAKDPHAVQYQIGLAYETMADFKNARKAYDAVESKEEKWIFRVQQALLRVDFMEAAMQGVEESKNPEIYNQLANLSIQAGDDQIGVELLEAGIKINPHYIKNFVDLTMYYLKIGDWARVSNTLELAESFHAGEPIFTRLKQYVIKERKSFNSSELVLHARIFLQAENYEKARRILVQALEQDADNYLTHHFMSVLESRTGNPKRAEYHHLRSLELVQESESKKPGYSA